ncbi:hypothetical protein [Muricoccus radiodurans]|uniref:hypothetical protein n=1 Tax=Muricoccus radiodurans TaxID=2231721 RepID=UPI003CEE9F8A
MPEGQLTAEPRGEARPLAPIPRGEALQTGSGAPPVIAVPRQAPQRAGGTRWIALLGLAAFLGYAGYELGWASDLYATEIRFAVRQADTPRLQPGPSLLGGGMLATVTESNAVVQYLRSRDALDGLAARLDLRRMFGRAEIDPLSRLSADASPEALLRHLEGHLRPHFDHTSGIVTVQLRAFSAEEARDLAVAVEALAEALVNRMSLTARQGLLAAVQGEAAEAERKLAGLRDRLREFRERNARLDPRRSAAAADELRARLETEISAQRALLDQQRRYLAEGAPPVIQARERLEALERELREQIRRNTGAGDEALTVALRGYEALEADTQAAQKSYEAVLATLERTRSDADRQQIYLAHVVRPSLPGSPSYPRHWQNIGTAAALCGLGGLLLLLLVRTLREHVR